MLVRETGQSVTVNFPSLIKEREVSLKIFHFKLQYKLSLTLNPVKYSRTYYGQAKSLHRLITVTS